jgi:hypothetical protein
MRGDVLCALWGRVGTRPSYGLHGDGCTRIIDTYQYLYGNGAGAWRPGTHVCLFSCLLAPLTFPPLPPVRDVTGRAGNEREQQRARVALDCG